MEIRIKTAKEFHDSHVTIEITAGDREEATEVLERLSTSDEVGLKDRVVVLEDQLAEETKRADKEQLGRRSNRQWAERAEDRVKELFKNNDLLAEKLNVAEASLEKLKDRFLKSESKAQAFNMDRKDLAQRLDQLRASSADQRHSLDTAEHRLTDVARLARLLVTRATLPDVSSVINIQRIQELTAPWSDSPSEPTSQA